MSAAGVVQGRQPTQPRTALRTDGWEGTSHELGSELDSFAERHRLFAFVPLCPGRQVAGLVPFLSANGFTLTHHRTKHTRTLRFTRCPL